MCEGIPVICIRMDGLQYEMKLLTYQRETGNAHYPYAVKVTKSGSIVGHLPKKISSTYSLSLMHGGVITCKLTDPNKQYSRDLEQGGLEIPCLLLFHGEQKLLEKAHKLLLLSEKSASEAKLSKTPCKIKLKVADVAPEAKRVKVEHTTESLHRPLRSMGYLCRH